MEFLKQHKKKAILIGICAAAFLLFIIILNAEQLNLRINTFLRILRPLLIGLVIAYLCNSFFRFYERKLFAKIQPHSIKRGLSLICTYLTLFAIVLILLLMILPQLISSIKDFADNFDVRMHSFLEDINGLITSVNSLLPSNENGTPILPTLSSEMIVEKLHEVIDQLLPQDTNILEYLSPELIGSIFNMAGDVITIFGDIIFGLFISLYLLATKEKRYAQIMRARRALFNDQVNAHITRVCTIADRSFGGFFKGKLTDSAIVGVLTYCLISIFQVPYAILIAAVVAITDIIPVIGPFIGVIPSAVIILLTDPPKVIPFLLMILVIQQIDGNIIAPKILGEHTGVSSLCVLIAITTMGAIWGFAGMILGVPLFATIMELSTSILDARLRKKGLPVDTAHYASDTIQEETEEKQPFFRRLFAARHTSKAESGRSSALTDAEKLQIETYAIARRNRIFSENSAEAMAQFKAEKEKLKQQKNPDPIETKNPISDTEPNK